MQKLGGQYRLNNGAHQISLAHRHRSQQRGTRLKIQSEACGFMKSRSWLQERCASCEIPMRAGGLQFQHTGRQSYGVGRSATCILHANCKIPSLFLIVFMTKVCPCIFSTRWAMLTITNLHVESKFKRFIRNFTYCASTEVFVCIISGTYRALHMVTCMSVLIKIIVDHCHSCDGMQCSCIDPDAWLDSRRF